MGQALPEVLTEAKVKTPPGVRRAGLGTYPDKGRILLPCEKKAPEGLGLLLVSEDTHKKLATQILSCAALDSGRIDCWALQVWELCCGPGACGGFSGAEVENGTH